MRPLKRGALPNDHEELLSFKGIGRYTAGAILSFAYRQDAPTLDTNVARVLSRLFGVRGDLAKAKAQRRLWQLAEAVIPQGKGYDFNQAMMDFGSAVCTPRKPQCPTCSMRDICRSYPLKKSSDDFCG